jgi:hypothetical protein
VTTPAGWLLRVPQEEPGRVVSESRGLPFGAFCCQRNALGSEEHPGLNRVCGLNFQADPLYSGVPPSDSRQQESNWRCRVIGLQLVGIFAPACWPCGLPWLRPCRPCARHWPRASRPRLPGRGSGSTSAGVGPGVSTRGGIFQSPPTVAAAGRVLSTAALSSSSFLLIPFSLSVMMVKRRQYLRVDDDRGGCWGICARADPLGIGRLGFCGAHPAIRRLILPCVAREAGEVIPGIHDAATYSAPCV